MRRLPARPASWSSSFVPLMCPASSDACRPRSSPGLWLTFLDSLHTVLPRCKEPGRWWSKNDGTAAPAVQQQSGARAAVYAAAAPGTAGRPIDDASGASARWIARIYLALLNICFLLIVCTAGDAAAPPAPTTHAGRAGSLDAAACVRVVRACHPRSLHAHATSIHSDPPRLSADDGNSIRPPEQRQLVG